MTWIEWTKWRRKREKKNKKKFGPRNKITEKLWKKIEFFFSFCNLFKWPRKHLTSFFFNFLLRFSPLLSIFTNAIKNFFFIFFLIQRDKNFWSHGEKYVTRDGHTLYVRLSGINERSNDENEIDLTNAKFDPGLNVFSIYSI